MWYSWIMRLFKKTPRVFNLEEYHRLSVCHNELPLREKLPSESQMDSIRNAKEYLFQNTPQISPLTNTRKEV
jgi:hypothetical protein